MKGLVSLEIYSHLVESSPTELWLHNDILVSWRRGSLELHA